MMLDPGSGSSVIETTYDGGTEMRVAITVSTLVTGLLFIAAIFDVTRRGILKRSW